MFLYVFLVYTHDEGKIQPMVLNTDYNHIFQNKKIKMLSVLMLTFLCFHFSYVSSNIFTLYNIYVHIHVCGNMNFAKKFVHLENHDQFFTSAFFLTM